MGNYRKGMYWFDEHEQLCKQWVSANTAQQFYVYKKLHPAIFKMSEMILHRYFNCPQPVYYDLIHDAINHLFINLKNYRIDTKAFSYVQTLIKNYYMDVLVIQPKYERNFINDIKNRYELDAPDLTEEGDMSDHLIINEIYDNIKEVDELREKVILIFKNDLQKIREKIYNHKILVKKRHGSGKSYKKCWLATSKDLIHEREYLKLAIKFFITHQSLDISAGAMNEYIYKNSLTLMRRSAILFSKKYVGYEADWETQSKYSREIVIMRGGSYLMDDYTPSSGDKYKFKLRKINRKNREYQYF
jgi:hypothetical protein